MWRGVAPLQPVGLIRPVRGLLVRTGGAGGSAVVSREQRRGRGARGFVCSAEPPVPGSGPGGVVLGEEGRGPPTPHIRIVLVAAACEEGAVPPTWARLWIGTMRGWGGAGETPRVPGAQVQAGCLLQLQLHFPGCPCGAPHVRQLPPPPPPPPDYTGAAGAAGAEPGRAAIA